MIELKNGATIVLRFGGWGDLFPVLAVCRVLKERFPKRPLDIAVRGKDQVAWISEYPIFRSVFEQVEEIGNRWVEWDLGVPGAPRALANLKRLPDAYDLVLDFMDTVENNPFADHGNWYDVALSYAGLDPEYVPAGWKRPWVILPKSAGDNAERLMSEEVKPAGPIVSLALAGSSPLRSMPPDFWTAVIRKVAGEVDGVRFYILTGPEKAAFSPTPGPNVVSLIGRASILDSAAVCGRSDCVIAADTGLGHFAEGLGVPTVSCYTTVKGWTRAKYHERTDIADSGLDCQCASLGALCPRLVPDVMAPLNGLQRKIAELRYLKPKPDLIAAQELGLSPEQYARESAMVETYRRTIHGDFAPCVRSITPERVAELTLKRLKGKVTREAPRVSEALEVGP